MPDLDQRTGKGNWAEAEEKARSGVDMGTMNRAPLMSMLSRYREKYPKEAATVDRFITFVSDNDNCFQRSLQEGHVTGSAWVVDSTGEKVLLTHHRKLDRWLQMGGHADGESDVLSVALREVEEESGLAKVAPISTEIFDVDIHLIPERGHEAEHLHYDIRFALVNIGDEAYTVSEESHDLKWINISNVSDYTNEESMLRMVRKWEAAPFSLQT
ncbi:MAG: NUDIX hydrolase [Flavobacteriaceae bacterium]